VHGLHRNTEQNWTHPKSKIRWLKDERFLPSEVHNARVIAFGYNVNTRTRDISLATLKEHAKSLVDGVARLRRECVVHGLQLFIIGISPTQL
jgi:hypothetical protein